MDRRMMMTEVKKKLPSQYQEVDYIITANDCYFNLGTMSYADIGFECDYLCTHRNNSYGPHVISTTNSYVIFNPRSTSLTRFDIKGGSVHDMAVLPLGKKIHVTGNLDGSGTCTASYDDVNLTSTCNLSTVTSGDVYLFAYAMDTSDTKFALLGNCYGIKFYDAGVLRQDWVPCYRKADNVIGLYDVINNVFKTTDGTGTLGKGGDIN